MYISVEVIWVMFRLRLRVRCNYINRGVHWGLGCLGDRVLRLDLVITHGDSQRQRCWRMRYDCRDIPNKRCV